MENFICIQCGTQFDATSTSPQRCTICEDERQFVHYGGQQWMTLERLAADHHNRFEDEAPQLLGIGTEPEFAIGQRALLLQSPDGNLLWDCISLLDDKTLAEVNARGGIRAIAISHPHFYSSMVEWAEHFDAQIFLHAADREAYWRERQRRIAHRRHHYCGARPPLRQLHAKLSKSYSARGRSDPSHSRNDRTVFLRSNLRRLVESKRLIRRQSGGRTIGRALSTSNRVRRELQLEYSQRLVLLSALEIASAGFICHRPQ